MEQILETQKNAVKVILEAEKMKETVARQSGCETKDYEMAMIPVAVYETQQDRNFEEKKAMRKHYRTIVIWISSVLIALIFGIIGGCIYLFSNYDFASYSQESDYGDVNYVGNDWNVTNGETVHKNNSTEE